MKRFIDIYLRQWKNQANFKPLLLRGARQVGKTYAVRELGKQFDQFVELNLESNPNVRNLFTKELDPKKIIEEIGYLTKKKITPGKTLLFFDEIQAEPQAILALRYFYEMMPELHVIAAGSLLDFAIEKVGVPVGRVEFLYMYPMSFLEFLYAYDNSILIEIITKHNNPEKEISTIAHEQLLKLVATFIALGGMPEVIKNFIQDKDLNQCFKTQQTLINSYKYDFNKYGKWSQIKYLDKLFESIPLLLGKKFKYSSIEGDFRKRELAPCLDLLVTAGVAHKIYHTDAQGLPLGAQADLEKFKILFLDIGLSQATLGLDISKWLLNPENQFINKGEIVEAFIGQELLAYSDTYQKHQLFYWLRTERTSQSEIDYVINIANKIVPIEVKSGSTGSLKSMHIFIKTHPKSPIGIKFSTKNYSKHNNIYVYPLYAIFTAIESKTAKDFIKTIT